MQTSLFLIIWKKEIGYRLTLEDDVLFYFLFYYHLEKCKHTCIIRSQTSVVLTKKKKARQSQQSLCFRYNFLIFAQQRQPYSPNALSINSRRKPHKPMSFDLREFPSAFLCIWFEELASYKILPLEFAYSHITGNYDMLRAVFSCRQKCPLISFKGTDPSQHPLKWINCIVCSHFQNN